MPVNPPSPFASASLARPLWPHQLHAIDAFERDRAGGDVATYLVVPPGGGKTLVGLEAARRLGRPTVVLCPNTAIQAQWIEQWHSAFAPVTVTATADRELPSPLTVLTYQALCNIEAQDQEGENGDPGGTSPLPRLHPNGLALIERLKAGGPWTVVLDECHHLLELWGRLLVTVISELDRPHVIGLTATPPQLMTAGQADLHRSLFGNVDLEVSAPALVRAGCLAPYQELAYLARPTPAEAEYIRGEAIRFTELRTDLLDPDFATVPFLSWLDTRVVSRPGADGAAVSWQRFSHDEPALADAALRLHTAGLLALPEGARVREQHRHVPTAADWVALIGDYSRRCLLASGEPKDQEAFEAIRRALPSVGYRLTKAGARASDSPVDRVLARSESKALAVTEILRAETAELGPRLRALVLCDFETAAGALPARLTGVLASDAGGAILALRTLLSDETAAELDPVLLTGRRVACGERTAGDLIAWLRRADPRLDPSASAIPGLPGLVDITSTGNWEPRRYVPLVTRFFTEGGSRCLVGTRGLLGEGWDAPAVNVMIDLTAATTPTSVVQARGRALRLDASWPGKVADNWAVVCVTDGHPKGSADYDRFVRKHDRYFALAATGDIVSGVSHVDPALSPFAPPPADSFDALNVAMLGRAEQREEVLARWAVGTPCEDVPVATVTVTTGRSLGLAGRATVPLARPRTGVRLAVTLAVLILLALAVLGGAPALAGAAAGLAVLAGLIAVVRTGRRITAAPASGGLEDLAAATAQALHQARLTSRGAESVRIEALPDGQYRARLDQVPAAESALFSAALDEVLSPLAQPRYLIPRLVVPQPASLGAALALAARRLVTGHLPGAVVYHSVPAALAGKKELALTFQAAWNQRVSPGEVVFASSPEGTGILAVQRGDDPFAVTTLIRTLWR